jgi:hypothetical protein
MKIDGGAIEFFQSLPDDLMVQIATNDWEALESLCVALTLDYQMVAEYYEKKTRTKKKKKGLAS